MQRSPSSAAIERLFSSLKLVKNKYRSKLSTAKLEMMATIRAYVLTTYEIAERFRYISNCNETTIEESKNFEKGVLSELKLL